jgi:prepilin-type N-terminal cleavage/methylation domain-containing protein
MNLNCHSKNDTSGFTLLEVLISMAILVFISFAIYQATVETFKLRDSLSTEGDFHNSIRLSTSIMQRDIALIYSPVVALPSPLPSGGPPGGANPQFVAGQTPMPDDLGRSYIFWGPAVNLTGLRPSRLIGTENKLSFIAISHYRIYKDAPASDFAKITYELKKDEKGQPRTETSVLVKTESPNAFAKDDVKDTFKRSYEILRGIKTLTYTYYMRDGNTWRTLKSWDTDKEDTKNRFPDIIELTMEVVGPKNQIFDGKFKFRPEIPFNGIQARF